MPLLRRSWTRRPGRRASVRSVYGLRSSRRRMRMTRSPSSLAQPRLVTAAPLRAVHFHTVTNTMLATTASTGLLLNAPPRGQAITNRTGNRIKMMSLIINGGFVMNPFGVNPSGVVSIDRRWQWEQQAALLIFYVPAPVTTHPPLSDYFSIFPGQSAVDTWSLRRISEIPTMRLLKRINISMQTQSVGPNGVTSPIRTSPPAKPFQLKINLDQLTSFSNDEVSPYAGGINGGSLYMYFLGDYNVNSLGAPANDQTISFRFEARLAFTNVD